MDLNSKTENYKNAFILMRVPFSFFLMPVYWFALSQLDSLDIFKAIFVFIIIHLFFYPASNGYNSFYDKDESSIGGLKNPPKVNQQLYQLVLLFDLISLGLSLLVSWQFALMILISTLFSKAYSYDKIRIKKYPILSTIVVTFIQGGFTFLMVQVGISGYSETLFEFPNIGFALVSTLFLLGSYPMTQIYQHEEDSTRGDKTISLMLGIWGTFIFSGIAFGIATGLFTYLNLVMSWNPKDVIIFLIATAPVLIVFNIWMLKVKRSILEVNFENTMKLNKISSLSLSAAFILMMLWKQMN